MEWPDQDLGQYSGGLGLGWRSGSGSGSGSGLGSGVWAPQPKCAHCMLGAVPFREVHSCRSPDFLRVFWGTVRSLEWQVRTVRTFLPGKLLHFRSGLWTGKTAESGPVISDSLLRLKAGDPHRRQASRLASFAGSEDGFGLGAAAVSV